MVDDAPARREYRVLARVRECGPAAADAHSPHEVKGTTVRTRRLDMQRVNVPSQRRRGAWVNLNPLSPCERGPG